MTSVPWGAPAARAGEHDRWSIRARLCTRGAEAFTPGDGISSSSPDPQPLRGRAAIDGERQPCAGRPRRAAACRGSRRRTWRRSARGTRARRRAMTAARPASRPRRKQGVGGIECHVAEMIGPQHVGDERTVDHVAARAARACEFLHGERLAEARRAAPRRRAPRRPARTCRDRGRCARRAAGARASLRCRPPRYAAQRSAASISRPLSGPTNWRSCSAERSATARRAAPRRRPPGRPPRDARPPARSDRARQHERARAHVVAGDRVGEVDHLRGGAAQGDHPVADAPNSSRGRSRRGS